MKAINLVPREQRRSFGALQGLGLGTTALFGALSLAFVVVAAYVVLANGVTSKQDELAQVKAQQTAATRQVAQLKPYADLEQLRASLLERVKSVAGSRYDWPGTLARIARAFPADSSLDSLDGTAAGDNGTGPTIAMSGCTPSHDAAAHLIDRLRAVKGVAGVALKSSKVDDPGTTAVAGTAGGPTCKEKFELSLSLEAPAGAAATATATGAPGAAAAAPSATPATGGTQ